MIVEGTAGLADGGEVEGVEEREDMAEKLVGKVDEMARLCLVIAY